MGEMCNAGATVFVERLEPRRLLAVSSPTNVTAWIGYREQPEGHTTRTHIGWSDLNSSETGYRVEWSADGLAGWQPIGPDRPPNSVSALHELDAGQKLHYRVRAVEGASVSNPSPTVTPTTPLDRVVQVSAIPGSGQLIISWPYDPDAISYQVSRKPRDGGANSWTVLTPLPLPANATAYIDRLSIAEGVSFEYEVVRQTKNLYGVGLNGPAYGYVYGGVAAPLDDSRGTALLVVDETRSQQLAPQLARFKEDLIGDGWIVDRIDVPRDDGSVFFPIEIKGRIKAAYDRANQKLGAIILIGHVPVPYSGTTDWDGHPNHVGAWPADVFYGQGLDRDVFNDYRWTDSATAANATYPDNDNRPGDGKYDNNNLPDDLLVPVGRIDFSNLPGLAWSFQPQAPNADVSESLLLQRYFDKDHAWRIGAVTTNGQAAIDDHIGGSQPENGWRNFAPLVGSGNTRSLNWESSLHTNSYLWGYGAGPSNSETVQGVTSIYNFHNPTVRYNSVFNLMYGSYFGDWNKANNVLREFIATNGTVLTSAWAGTPNWFMHTMGLGETIGQATILSVNNAPADNTYQPSAVGMQASHIALMGDPTLRMTAVKPASNPLAWRIGPTMNIVRWNASPEAGLAGYYVYRATSPNGPFVRITPSLVPPAQPTQLFIDTAAINSVVRYTYMVRPVKLQSTASGTFYDAGVGVFAESSAWGSTPQNLQAPGPDFGGGDAATPFKKPIMDDDSAPTVAAALLELA